MAADDNLWQQFQFSCYRIHFGRKKNGVDRALLWHIIKHGWLEAFNLCKICLQKFIDVGGDYS